MSGTGFLNVQEDALAFTYRPTTRVVAERLVPSTTARTLRG
ncbi:hypothetical protein [Nocardioides ferulae]|nr:hypothetical protein [Nocardioides ferulae]